MAGIPDTLVFDGHNDLLLDMYEKKRPFFTRHHEGHIDLPRAREGNLGGGFCAVWVPPAMKPAKTGDAQKDLEAAVAPFRDDATMPPSPELGYAQRTAMALAAILFRVEAESQGQVKVVRTAQE